MKREKIRITAKPHFTIKQAAFQKPIEEFVNYALAHHDVVSIILFGSVAKGTARENSDVDLLLVIRNLPPDWRKRDALFTPIITQILLRHHLRIFPLLCSPEALLHSAEQGNPLLYGLLTGYQVLYDDGFFPTALDAVKCTIQQVNPIYIEGDQEWALAKII